MNTFILIMVLGFYSTQSGGAVVQQEFDSQATCQQAADVLMKNVIENAQKQYLKSTVVSYGCYKK